MSQLALMFTVIGLLLIAFTWERAEVLGDDFEKMADMSRCIIGGYLSLMLGVLLALLAFLS